MTAAIEVQGLKKTFRVGFFARKSPAVRDASLRVEPGEVFGFIGPNGAGKTTTIKAMLGLIQPDAGTLSVLGHSTQSMQWRQSVGYLPEHPTFYDYLSGFELVCWFARLAGQSRHEAELQAKRQLERVGMGYAMHRRIRKYSKGMVQRAALAQALVGQPKLLVLDEPMTGLDPIGRRDIRQLILELRQEGTTVFYSTHILPDVEMTCDRVGIIEDGYTRYAGRVDEFIEGHVHGVSVVVARLDEATLRDFTAKHPNFVRRGTEVEFDFPDQESALAFVEQIRSTSGELRKYERHRPDLEAIFMNSLKASGQGPTP